MKSIHDTNSIRIKNYMIFLLHVLQQCGYEKQLFN